MTREEIEHLANLARIKLTEEEIEKFIPELSAVLDYVSTVQTLTAGATDTEPVLGARYNVVRSDTATNEADSHSRELLAEMPQTEGRYLMVKKILQSE